LFEIIESVISKEPLLTVMNEEFEDYPFKIKLFKTELEFILSFIFMQFIKDVLVKFPVIVTLFEKIIFIIFKKNHILLNNYLKFNGIFNYIIKFDYVSKIIITVLT